MPAAIHNFLIEQGSDFFISFEYLDTNSTPIDLSNYCVILKFRDNENPNKYAQYSSEITNGSYRLRKTSTGIIEWYLQSAETRTFNFNSASYDLLLFNNSSLEMIRLATGTIEIIKTNFPECDGTRTDSPCKTCDQISLNDAWSQGDPTLPDSITFVAPFSGIISSIAVTGGQIVNTSDTLITINRLLPTGGGDTGGGDTGGGDTGGGDTGGGDTGGGSPSALSQEDLCDYLCQGLDLFGKLYKYSDNVVVSSENSGYFNVISPTSSFTLPTGYVSGTLEVYLNSTGLSPSQFSANGGQTISLINLSSFGRPTNSAISGDTVTWIHKGILIYDQSSSINTMNISNTGIIMNLEVTINNLKHTSPQDLSMVLVPPSGPGILLSAYNKINNYSPNVGINYTFSNKATNGVYLNNRSVNDLYVNILDKTNIYNTANFPIIGTSLSSDLTTLNGISSSGDWSLVVSDQDLGGSGTIDGWNLVVTYPPISYSSE